MVSDDASDTVSRPEFDDMIVSVTRHRKSGEDDTFTTQFPLEILKDKGDNSYDSSSEYLDEGAFQTLKSRLEDRLKISLTGMSIMWCLIKSDKLAMVNDRDSLCAAVMDHQLADKNVVELYVVKNSGKTRRRLDHVSSAN
jgi:hypothetical protein